LFSGSNEDQPHISERVLECNLAADRLRFALRATGATGVVEMVVEVVMEEITEVVERVVVVEVILVVVPGASVDESREVVDTGFAARSGLAHDAHFTSVSNSSSASKPPSPKECLSMVPELWQSNANSN
jgi:hypothetical protein